MGQGISGSWFSNQITAGTSYFSLPGMFQEEIIIDFDQMSIDLSGDPMKVFMLASTELHSSISILGVTLGGYLNIDAAVSPELPYGVVDIIANGIDLVGDETDLVTISGEASVYGRVFAKTGVYLGYQAEKWVAGLKAGPYIPVFYTDPRFKLYVQPEC